MMMAGFQYGSCNGSGLLKSLTRGSKRATYKNRQNTGIVVSMMVESLRFKPEVLLAGEGRTETLHITYNKTI